MTEKMQNLKFNGSGCLDLTAYEAIKNVDQTNPLANRLIRVIKHLADMCGFEIIGRIGLRDKVNGKEYL